MTYFICPDCKDITYSAADLAALVKAGQGSCLKCGSPSIVARETARVHDCPRCGADRTVLAGELRNAPLGHDARILAIAVAENCPACRPTLRRWWRVFGWRKWVYRTVRQAEDLVAAIGGVA